MGITQLLRGIIKLVKWSAVIYVATIVGLLLFNVLYDVTRPDPPRNADVIVVLGGGHSADGNLSQYSFMRMAKGFELLIEQRAPRIVFSGGVSNSGRAPIALLMADVARNMGVPNFAVGIEPSSTSTLQNALYSVGTIENLKTAIIVTDGYHLPRAWASFAWAGDHDLILERPGTLRTGDKLGFKKLAWGYAREGLAIWFNLGRVALYEVLELFGVSYQTRLDLMG